MLWLHAFILLAAWKGPPVGLFGTSNSFRIYLLGKLLFLDLLIDIADVIDIDVYTLGHNFMQIAKMFNLNIPSVGRLHHFFSSSNFLELIIFINV